MKTSTVGLVLAAILMVMAGVGFGIAQAGGNHSEQPVISLEGMDAMEALEQGGSSSHYARVLQSGIDLDYDADGNPSTDVAQARGPVETGSLPTEMDNADFDPFSRGGP
jgi:hypothetical protein